MGSAESAGPVQGLWGGDGAWVAGGTHADAYLEGSRGGTDLGIQGPWRVTADVQNGFPDHRGTAELSG